MISQFTYEPSRYFTKERLELKKYSTRFWDDLEHLQFFHPQFPACQGATEVKCSKRQQQQADCHSHQHVLRNHQISSNYKPQMPESKQAWLVILPVLVELSLSSTLTYICYNSHFQMNLG